jgi:hypothetical protein
MHHMQTVGESHPTTRSGRDFSGGNGNWQVLLDATGLSARWSRKSPHLISARIALRPPPTTTPAMAPKHAAAPKNPDPRTVAGNPQPDGAPRSGGAGTGGASAGGPGRDLLQSETSSGVDSSVPSLPRGGSSLAAQRDAAEAAARGRAPAGVRDPPEHRVSQARARGGAARAPSPALPLPALGLGDPEPVIPAPIAHAPPAPAVPAPGPPAPAANALPIALAGAVGDVAAVAAAPAAPLVVLPPPPPAVVVVAGAAAGPGALPAPASSAGETTTVGSSAVLSLSGPAAPSASTGGPAPTASAAAGPGGPRAPTVVPRRSTSTKVCVRAAGGACVHGHCGLLCARTLRPPLVLGAAPWSTERGAVEIDDG